VTFHYKREFFEFTLEARIRKLFHMSQSLLVVCLFLLIPFPSFSQEVPPEPASHEGLFEKGLDAYQKKQFTEARDAFQRLLDGESGKPRVSVLHNLALSEFQLDQKPRALAMWRKALSEQPDFKPARQGRDYLESQTSMRPFERDSAALWQRRALEQISIYQLLWLEALLLGLTGSIGIRYFSERQTALDGQLPLPPFPTLGAVLSVFFILSTAAIGLKVKDDLTTRATVVVKKANVRSLPADEGVSLFELSGGTELLVRRITNPSSGSTGGNTGDSWLQVQSSDGASGWIKSTEALITSQH
jgi:tetratricopeptide (TPR) repeat protein